MNIVITEVPSKIVAKICGDKSRKVTYTFVDAYHGICLDKKDRLSSERKACERLLKYSLCYEPYGLPHVIRNDVNAAANILDRISNFWIYLPELRLH
ncbi:MAG: hypothetical protein WA667_11825 [Candidatus Nitrosopolaris sp.]